MHLRYDLLTFNTGLYPRDSMQAELYSQILIWPLKIEPEPTARDWIDSLEKFMTAASAWRSANDLYSAGDGDSTKTNEEHTRYAQFVYFHPFVQQLLFSKDTSPVFRVLRRDDVKKMHVKLASSEHLLDVLRVRLYLVRTGIILLVVEVKGKAIDLHEVQDLADSIRRSYPPFWRDNGEAGLCPREVTWLNEVGRVLSQSNYGDAASHMANVREHRHPPVCSHWQWLLEPLRADALQFRYRHIEDERIPSMCYFAFADPTQLTDGDFFRLGLMDGRGNSASLPYAKPFFSDFIKQSSYDRFWDPTTPGHEWMTTRYLCTDFSFVMIGRMEPGFYANAENGALAHFRHHYFQMGLIGHLQKASLLLFAGRLAEFAAGTAESPSRDRNYRKIEKLVSDIADFTGRFWFTELSNQLQGRELFTLWSQTMGTNRLFQRVMDSTRFVQQDLADYERYRQTRAALSLTKVGAYGVPLNLMLMIGLAVAATNQKCPHPYLAAVGAVAVSILLGLAIGRVLQSRIEREPQG
jgi:hypothetical protein